MFPNFYFGILTQNITSGRGEKRGDRGKKRKEVGTPAMLVYLST